MPPRQRRPLLPVRPARHARLALLILAVGIGVGSGAPATPPDAAAHGLVPTIMPEAAPLIAEVAGARATPGPGPDRAWIAGRMDAPATIEPTATVSDLGGASAAFDPLAVGQGDLTVRWREADSIGAGITKRIARVERAPVVAVEAKPETPKWTGMFNLYRANSFVTQKTFRWCVAASVQMMVNLVRHRTDRSRATQARMIAYAQRWDDGPYGEEGGTDVTGWINALRHYGAGRYRAVGATTAARALRVAATAMRQTGRPAGILVMDGRHAWVLHGFESTTDPRRNRRANITAVRVSGPLYPVQQKGGYDPRPNTRFTARRLARYFTPTSVGTMVGKYVVVIPTH